MGISIYTHWKPRVRHRGQIWRTANSGERGYVSEGYSSQPYALAYLCAEAFRDEDEVFQRSIPAKVLRERLPRTLQIVGQLGHRFYGQSLGEIEKARQSIRDFVDFCEEKEKESGEPVYFELHW